MIAGGGFVAGRVFDPSASQLSFKCEYETETNLNAIIGDFNFKVYKSVSGHKFALWTIRPQVDSPKDRK